jgi:SAM-dependent methyltransferase
MCAGMRLVNQTRYSPSIPKRLFAERKFHLIPLYYVARLSCLAAEGIENSGSYRFADHIYAGKPKGRFGIGKLIDALLLSLPATRSFRNRYVHSRETIVSRLPASHGRVLSVPSGIPRDLIEAAQMLRSDATKFYCMDIDPAVLQEAGAMSNFELIEADAFDERAYPRELDIITTTGFAEFLEDGELVRFYNICFRALRDGGTLITSATVRNRVADYLLRNLAELLTHYREEEALRDIFRHTPFRRVEMHRDAIGYQVLIAAERML